MQYVEQNYSDLRLYVMPESCNKDILTVISETHFSTEMLNINFGILAESHFVILTNNEGSISEICACTELDINDTQSIVLTSLKEGEKKEVIGAYSYNFECDTTNMSDSKDLLEKLHEKRPHSHTYYLEHIFPPESANADPAITEVYVTVDNGVLIESVHTYPNDDVAVFTKTKIDMK